VPTLTPEQRAKERSVLFALCADNVMLFVIFVVAVFGGSLTLMAESVRGALMNSIEGYSLVVLRRIHRGVLVGFEFGVGKLEQICNLAIAAGMLGGALWVAHGAVVLAARGYSEASPLGLALAAAIGATNTLLNFMAWDEVRRAARHGGSVIMEAQLKARVTKLASSVFVQLTMTVAAVATDPVIVAWADGAGSVFVSSYMLAMGLGMIRSGLPELLDRTVDETTHLLILRALARHEPLYATLTGIRARRSGVSIFVEIGLGFDDRLALAEVDRRISAIKASVAEDISGADVSILVSGERVAAA
jgi:divalent metal cation (Fe/Co/Zn/Cd) transporter